MNVDPNVAPDGFEAVSINELVRTTTGSVCQECDWSNECDLALARLPDNACLLPNSNWLCNGQDRKDGACVIFKTKL